MLQYLILAPVLFVFWLLLSGHYTPFFFTLGVISVAIVLWLQYRMDKVDQEPPALKMSLGIIQYGLWLAYCVLKSNMDVAKRIWDPKLPISPVWERLDIEVKTPREKAIYANSITLTPGTLTTDVKEDHFLIHTLTPEGMEELKQGEMEQRIKRLGV